MHRFIFSFIFSIVFYLIGQSQQLVSATKIGSATKAQLISATNIPLISYGVVYYKVLYTSVDAKGQKDTLSGLLAVPDNKTKRYPQLLYLHGTSDCKTCVPSHYGTNGGSEGQLGLIAAGLGFVSLLPDYVGMGEGRGFQTYVHAGTIVSSTMDMISAVSTWCSDNQVAINEQLFITGYSQGGYASMAVHKYLEENPSIHEVTAASHMSGPYNLSHVMKGLILSEESYNYPAYIPNTILGYQEVYGNLYNDLSEVFKDDFIADIQSYYNGSISLTTLNIKLLLRLNTDFGKTVAKYMLKDAYLQEIESNPNHPSNLALRENDLFRWAPKAPTQLLYCKADDQVPYENSVTTRDTMLALGAAHLKATDVNSNFDHGQCFNPALTNTILFFLPLQSITSETHDIASSVENVQISYKSGYIDVLSEVPLIHLEIFDFYGQRLLSLPMEKDVSWQLPIRYGSVKNVIVNVSDIQGNITSKKLLIY